MIYVKRTAPPPSLDFTDANSAAAKERQRAKDYFDKRGLAALPDVSDFPAAVPLSPFEFTAYADKEVRKSLIKMFSNKCAYCESQIAGSSQTDVEHYRPKGGVKGADHPGYWWLAMDWSNLVLSCMHCNQERRQLILPPDLSEAEILKAIIDNDLKTTGKKNAFPTEDDAWVTDPATAMATERPLLLDPTVTDPEPLLTWMGFGDFAGVNPRDGNRRADVTIQTLGLNRSHLRQERMTKFSILSLHMIKIRAAIDEFNSVQTDREAELVMMHIKNLVELMAAMGDARQSHAALARDFLVQAKTLIATTIP